MTWKLFAMCLAAGSAIVSQTEAQTNVACLGTSITFIGNYTTPLAQKLGSAYSVGNWGENGTTIFMGCGPWLGSQWNPQDNIVKIINAKPQICTLEFGANDVHDWNQRSGCVSGAQDKAKFIADYNRLLDSLVHNINPVPRLFICLPTPNFTSGTVDGVSDFDVIRDSVIPAVREVAAARSIPIIDNYTPCANHPEYFGDGLHPNTAGGQVMADVMYQAITGTTAAIPTARAERAAVSRGCARAQGAYDMRGRLLSAGVVRGNRGLRVGTVMIHE
jgi:lysophospholipase L1-like esterase